MDLNPNIALLSYNTRNRITASRHCSKNDGFFNVSSIAKRVIPELNILGRYLQKSRSAQGAKRPSATEII